MTLFGGILPYCLYIYPQIKNPKFFIMTKNFYIRLISFFVGLAYVGNLQAQSFSVLDFTQIFVPKISATAEFQTPRPLKQNDTISYHTLAGGIQAQIPVAGKIGLDLNLDKLKNWKNIKSWKDFKNIGNALPVDISAYQVFWTIAGNIRQQNFAFDTTKYTGYGFSTGVSGIHLQKKFKLLFYSANIGFSEDKNTLANFQPIFNGYVGQARVSKYGFIYYYGAYLNYTDKRLIPVPFVGIYTGIPPLFSLQVTLPFQARFIYQKNKKLRAAAEVSLGAFQTGFQNRQSGWLPMPSDSINTGNRFTLNNTYLKATTTAEHRTEGGRLSIEVGTVLWRSAQFYEGNSKVATYNPKTAPYIAVTYQANLSKKSLIKSVWDKLEFKW